MPPRARYGPGRGKVKLMGGFLMQEKEMRERRRRKWEAEKKRQKRAGVVMCAIVAQSG